MLAETHHAFIASSAVAHEDGRSLLEKTMMLRGWMVIAVSLLAGCVSVPATRYYGGDGDYYYGSGSAGVVIDSYGYGGGFGYGGFGGYGPGYGGGWGYGLGYGGGYYAPWYGGWGYGHGYAPWHPSPSWRDRSPRRTDPGLEGRHGERLQAAPERYDGRRPATYPGAGDGQRMQRVNPAGRPSGVLRAPPARSTPPERLMPNEYRGGGRDRVAPGRPDYSPAAGMRSAPQAPSRASAPQRVAPSQVAPARRTSTDSE